jgi:hypothetical protein
MIQPPSPPEKAREHLRELKEYYRELMEYHQQAARIAAQQLVYVEALLGKDTGSHLERMTFWLLGEPSLIQYDSNDDNSLNIKDALPTLEELRDFFKNDRGKMLQIDYIIQYFYGQVNQFEKREIEPLLLERLKTGSLKHLWSQVPDAPDCWTFSLLDFREFSNKNGDNPLFPNLNSDVLPTKKVAEILSTKPEKLYEVRNVHSNEFIEGNDYFRNSQGHYLWTENGVNKLSQFKQELESQKKQNKVKKKQ